MPNSNRHKNRNDRPELLKCPQAIFGKSEVPRSSEIRGIYTMYSTPFKDLFVRDVQKLEESEQRSRPIR